MITGVHTMFYTSNAEATLSATVIPGCCVIPRSLPPRGWRLDH